MIRARGVVILQSLTLAAALAACSPPDEAREAADADERGELEVRVVDHFDGTSELRYGLLREGRARVSLRFADDPKLAPGTPLAVWGRRHAEVLQVERFSAL